MQGLQIDNISINFQHTYLNNGIHPWHWAESAERSDFLYVIYYMPIFYNGLGKGNRLQSEGIIIQP